MVAQYVHRARIPHFPCVHRSHADLFLIVSLGGSADDSVSAIALDASGNICQAGWTDSVHFPVEDAFKSSNRGGVEAFVAKLNPAGSALLYARFSGWDV